MSSPGTQGRPAHCGRFAPSATGPLHFGSLITAVASFVDARAQGGRWLLRIEDLDRPRTRPGASDRILRSLEAHSLEWDETPRFQSQGDQRYAAALERLARAKVIFYCDCSRRELRGTAVYPGYCRARRKAPPAAEPGSHAVRLQVPSRRITFTDLIQGSFSQELASELGDFVIRRRDGLFAYQLAVVVDDALDGVTRILRGADLLDNTPRQILIAELLGHPQPEYGHLPVMLDRSDTKLSKQTSATAIDDRYASDNLVTALELLGQQPPAGLRRESADTVLRWAAARWDLSAIPARSALPHFYSI